MDRVYNVESFNLDHTKVKAPYIRLVDSYKGEHGDVIYKYDVRFKQPNKDHMEMKSLHSLEHLMAEHIRNHIDNIIDFSPMGCQTGFYLTIMNNSSFEQVANAFAATLQDILKADAVPACNEQQCGWAANHSLEGAKNLAQEMLNSKEKWADVFG